MSGVVVVKRETLWWKGLGEKRVHSPLPSRPSLRYTDMLTPVSQISTRFLSFSAVNSYNVHILI